MSLPTDSDASAPKAEPAANALPSDFNTWAPEAKANYIASLKQKAEDLKRKQAGLPPAPPAQAPGAKQYPPTKFGYAYVGSKHGNNQDDDYFDDDEGFEDDDLDDEYDDDLAMFEDELNAANINLNDDSAGTPSAASESSSAFVAAFESAANPAGETTVKTDPFAKREFLGDFELLRLAKMGDVQSFFEFEKAMGADVTTFVDNRHRNALHYAVDGGNMALVEYLIGKKVPIQADELGITPAHIAVMLQRDAKLLEKLGGCSESFDKLMDRFAPPVPRFCLSKAPPTVKPAVRPRLFWGPTGSTATTLLPRLVLETFEPEKEHPAGCRTQFFTLTNKPVENSVFTWAKAFDSEAHFAPVYAQCLGIGAAHPNETDGGLVVAGSILALPLNGQLVTKQGVSLSRPAACGQLHVSGLMERKGVAARLLRELSSKLRELNVSAAFFRSRERLPLEPVCLVKWLRRCIDPLAVIARVDIACEIMPDFFNYEERLRVDAAVKGYMPLVPIDQSKPQTWNQVLAADSATFEQLFQFYVASIPTQAEVYWQPEGPADIANLAKAFDIFVKKSSAGKITDFFALRTLKPRDTETRILGAVIVLSLFTTVTGEAKVLEIAKLVRQYNFSVLYATNTCGFTDSDLSKAQFEEIESYREYLYVAKSEAASVLTTSVVASKVFLPVGPL